MSAPLRIRRAAPQAVAPSADTSGAWMERLVKLVPAEILAVYLAGRPHAAVIHGAWPMVSELEAAAEVSRGTAAAALKALRAAPLPAPHLLSDRTHAVDARAPEPSRDTGPETDEEARTP